MSCKAGLLQSHEAVEPEQLAAATKSIGLQQIEISRSAMAMHGFANEFEGTCRKEHQPTLPPDQPRSTAGYESAI